ncbi:MAG: MerR family transcriptional regulator [Planctomycetes bacterium]|nr:MerR family transcriptional regulator [Planctomycetota bacterium]
MKKDKLVSISEFARLSGISRPNLIYYDNYGLLHPEKVGGNKYRYYGLHQFEAAYLIMTLKEFGMPLRDIKALAGERTPGSMAEIFTEQKRLIERQIEILIQRRASIQVYIDALRQMAEDRKTGGILIKKLKAEPLVLGPVIKNFDKSNASDYFVEFFNQVAKQGLPFGFPVGSMVEKTDLLEKRWGETRRMYFRAPQSRDKKKAGLYVVGYSKGDFFSTSTMYKKLHVFIKKNNLEIAGNAYEDYLLDAILVTNPDDYLMRLSIQVREKRSSSLASK